MREPDTDAVEDLLDVDVMELLLLAVLVAEGLRLEEGLPELDTAQARCAVKRAPSAARNTMFTISGRGCCVKLTKAQSVCLN